MYKYIYIYTHTCVIYICTYNVCSYVESMCQSLLCQWPGGAERLFEGPVGSAALAFNTSFIQFHLVISCILRILWNLLHIYIHTSSIYIYVSINSPIHSCISQSMRWALIPPPLWSIYQLSTLLSLQLYVNLDWKSDLSLCTETNADPVHPFRVLWNQLYDIEGIVFMHLFVHPCINLSCSLHVSNGDISLCLLVIEAQLRDKSEKEELYRLRQALNSTCSTCKRCSVRHCLRPKLKGRRASTLCSVSVTIWTLFHKPLFLSKDLGQRSG